MAYGMWRMRPGTRLNVHVCACVCVGGRGVTACANYSKLAWHSEWDDFCRTKNGVTGDGEFLTMHEMTYRGGGSTIANFDVQIWNVGEG